MSAIGAIDRWALSIPFRVAFRHAAATRTATAAIWVEARGADGLIGVGEGCPREYVTGESVATALDFVDRYRDSVVATVHDLSSLQQWMANHRQAIDDNPAAWCALELALIDLFAHEQQQPVEVLLGEPLLQGPFVYTAVLGSTGTKEFAATFQRYQKAGLRDYKIKLSGDASRDSANMDILKGANLSPDCVRADANNLWSDQREARDYLKSLDYPFFAIEEPLRPGQFPDLAALAESLDVRIVLDESITRESQLMQLTNSPERWIVNLRVSKMGGLVRSLAVARRCREIGLAMIVGAQVGETSLLTRAALTVVQAVRDIVIAQEGAFGTLLLENDPVQPNLMFGASGGIDVSPFRFDSASGFGMKRVQKIERYLTEYFVA